MIPVQKLHPKATLPTRAHTTDAGWDLYALGDTPLTLDPQPIPTGIAVAIPEGHAGLICPRSGLASKGISIANAPGIIDPGYTGEIKVLLYDMLADGGGLEWVRAGERIAQLIIVETHPGQLTEVDALDASDRGDRGFGSTGR